MSTPVGSTTSKNSFIDSLQKNSGAKKDTSKAEEQQNKFLKLLTEQLKNQDPLSPMDNAQMTSQLAQINTVDGIEKLNATLTQMFSSSQSAETLQAAALVGKGVLVEGKGLQLSGSQAYGGFELSGPADDVTVSIKDSSGLEVAKLELGAAKAGVQSFVWDGATKDGTPAKDGDYTIAVSAKQGDKDLKPTALQLGAVGGVTRGTAGVSIDVGSLGRYSLSDIKQIL